MIRRIAIILTGIATSLFMFPFNLPVAVTINTKMVVALAGLLLFGFDLIKKRSFAVSLDFFILSLICIFISIWALVSTTLNGTSERAFTTYAVSIWVWLGGAYAIVSLYKAVHRRVTVEIIGNYMAAVCTMQCILAYAMTLIPALKEFIDSLMGDSEMFMGTAAGRLYGLGAALDPTGLRFAAVLIILFHLLSSNDFSDKGWTGLLHLLEVIVIIIIGCMISRTTLIGFGLGLAYFVLIKLTGRGKKYSSAFWKVTLPTLFVGVVLCAWLYNTNLQFRSNIRFGFEGFFSLAEKGRWEVNSTNILKGMVVWPESLRTWIIGDGYFDNPIDIPDSLGHVREGFYMKTDIGYLRYIFFFGVIGLVGMISVFIQITVTCCRNLKSYAPLFIFLLLMNLIGWIKVSSDIIMIFAPFLVLAFTESTVLQEQNLCEPAECTSSTT